MPLVFDPTSVLNSNPLERIQENYPDAVLTRWHPGRCLLVRFQNSREGRPWGTLWTWNADEDAWELQAAGPYEIIILRTLPGVSTKG